MILAIELPLFSRIMQTRYHLKEFRELNLIPRIVIKSFLNFRVFSPLGIFGNSLFFVLQKMLVSNETVMSSD